MNSSKKSDKRFWKRWKKSGAVGGTPSKVGSRDNQPAMRVIGDPKVTIYIREDGGLYAKLNKRFHVKTRLSDDGRDWLGDGTAEEFDPNELVAVVQ